MSNPAESELAHLHVWELLPWIVNGRASDAERKLVDAHVRDCERCRAELASQRKLCAAMGSREQAGPDVERGLDHLWERFDEDAQPVLHTGTSSSAGAPMRSRMTAIACGLAAIVLLETGALATLGFTRGADSAPASYRTLSQADAGTTRATIRLVADPAMPVGRLQALLVPLRLQIVGGPSENGVYSLAPVATPGDVAKQLAVLRAAPGVRFAEPVGEGAGGP
ncbi:zf-HC2 domain-containing protein [Paraburkholderia rhynchosiae]|uniref:Putative zinc-finger domain-containing protein n=1 Tax=Paraburkholderia rhynchosiae TaxID=487049 RepID=A0A2N7W616_9BURK|nr:zf-HC2 domain-containing protein [Paraburkholderia rhynchosiae]PMS24832.1 hypothetical protein C0Z16_30285 [Paraburkholderia rhynchosiae]CAB3725390.1 hypothetical protein LMG27174_05316 [Paraburkholderia rhynchosiae]